MPPPDLEILFEDNHLLVLNKPAGLATMGVESGEPSLWERAKRYLKHKYNKPGNVYLGVVSRVDSLVTGVVIFARTSKAAARLSDQFRRGDVDKEYWAIVERPPQPAAGACEDWLFKDEPRQRMEVSSTATANAKLARLSYETCRRLSRGTWLVVRLETGRKHQIRVQLSHRGWPVLGDRKYGATTSFPTGIALHSRRLRLAHPVGKQPLDFIAPPPPSWREFGVTDEREH